MQIPLVMFLVMVSTLFTLLMIVMDENDRLFSMFASVFWIISAASVTIIHQPYVYHVRENGEWVVKEEVQTISQNWPMWTLFIGLALFCLFYLFVESVEDIKSYLPTSSGYGGNSGY